MKEKKTNCGIYEIKNTGNNKCYIGSSSNLKSRKYMHLRLLERNKHPNIHLQKSYNKNDKENFIFSVIQYVDKINDKYLLKEELLKWEQYHIDNYKSNNGKLYNIRKKEESNLGIYINKGKNHPQYGKKLSEETKGKISLNNIGKHSFICSEETRIKIRSTRRVKKVINLTTGEVFASIREAADCCNIGSAGISNVCNGKNRTSRGCEWKLYGNNNINNKKSRQLRVTNSDTGKEFKSIREAAHFYSINASSIGAVCQGNRKTAGGYIWKYLNIGRIK